MSATEALFADAPQYSIHWTAGWTPLTAYGSTPKRAIAASRREHEGAWSANTGNGYFGGYQFLLDTWRSVGGYGRPDVAPPREQTYRAWLVWKRDGGSWREWGTARACGLR